MSLSRRALRKIRRTKRMSSVTSINLVSMIDIFTIMIIYLLVNTAAVQIAGAEQVDMPKSIAQEPPRETVSVVITLTDILVGDKPVMTVADAEHGGVLVLPALKERLIAAMPPPAPPKPGATPQPPEVNILADKNIEYTLLKKVMATCGEASFAKISLGVLPISQHAGG